MPPLKTGSKPLKERSAAPNVRLDPHGLAGTGTARRLRLARRRRHWQWFLAAIAATLFVLLILGYLLRPGLPPLALRELQSTGLGGATAWTPLPNGDWLVATEDGALWRATPRGQSLNAALVARSDFSASAASLVVQGLVFSVTLDGSVSAYDEKTNRLRWRAATGASISTAPALWRRTQSSRAVLAVSNDAGQVFGFAAASGQRLWAVGIGGPAGRSMVATRDGLLVSTLPGASSGGGLIALDPNSGQRRWRLPQDARYYAPSMGAPLYEAATNQIYWATDDGAVFCLNATNGVLRWKKFASPLPSSPSGTAVLLRGSPLLWQNLLVVGGEDGGLRAFDAKNGSLLWTAMLEGAIEAAPSVLKTGSGERLMVAAGAQFALIDPKTGSIQASTAQTIALCDPKTGLVLDREGTLFHLEP